MTYQPRNSHLLLGLVLSALLTNLCLAQEGKPADPIAQHLVPVQQLLSRADEIGLSPQQIDTIRSVAQRAHRELIDPKKQLQAAYASLSDALSQAQIDQESTLERVDQLLELERSIKRRHLEVLVATNAQLTPEQRQKLRPGVHQAAPAKVDPQAIRDEIESMREDEVAWRKIDWKTCLLDGLKASREQNKPIAMWMFIDRPVDDKRC